MKKIFQLALLGVMGLSLASCNEDYKDWAAPQTTTQEAAVTIPGYQASAVGAIDLAQVTTDDVTLFTLSSATLPDGFELKDTRIELTPEGVENAKAETLNTSNDGKAVKKEVKIVTESIYGKDPVARTFKGHVFSSAIKDGQAVLIDAGTIDVVVTPPGLAASYKLVINDETEYSLANSGVSAYEDPEFKASVTTTVANSTWKIVDANGEVLATGTIENIGKYNVKVNVKTNNAEVNKAPSFLYMKGNANGWNGYDGMECINEEGTQFRGFMYLDQNGFKFCTQTDWNGTNYGKGFSTAGDADNIIMTEPAGYYQVVVDLDAKTYKLTSIKTIGIIGNATPGLWATDTDLTYNAEERCWELKGVELIAGGEYKFRANDAWDIQWGFDGEKYVYSNNAPSAKCTETGTYDIKLYAWATGFAKCEVIKK